MTPTILFERGECRVVLPDPWLARARAIAARREADGRAYGLNREKYQVKREPQSVYDYYAACGEYAAWAVLAGPEPCTSLTFHAPDVGTRSQIRTVGPFESPLDPARKGLIVRPNDPPGHCYTLVRADLPSCHLRGWIEGVDAQALTDCRRGDPPFWLIPADRLRPMHTHPELRPWVRPDALTPDAIQRAIGRAAFHETYD